MGFGRTREQTDLLFCNVDWHSVAEHQKGKMTSAIDNYDADQLLNTSTDDLAEYFVTSYRIDVPVLDLDAIVADQKEVQIDVSQDQLRYIRDRSRPFYITGTRIEVEVPFSGEPEVFRIQPTTFTLNPPRGEIRGSALILAVQGTKLDPEAVRPQIDQQIELVNAALGHLQSSAAGLHEVLTKSATERIEGRKKKLLADRDLVSGLGFPMKRREDASRSYAAPDVRRKIVPEPPQASTEPYRPQPELTTKDYENILSIIERMVGVMEFSPHDFAQMGEETLRSHFLVQLNAQYEGQATGETFNYEGKTDILIKSEGRNIFIAECKFWRGAKQHTKTISQLLGYLSWRDTKAALIVFSRNKNFTSVLAEIQRVTLDHPNCKRLISQRSESGWTYCFSHRDDPNREMTVSVLAFNIPESSE